MAATFPSVRQRKIRSTERARGRLARTIAAPRRIGAPRIERARAAATGDPRLLQILFLGILLAAGVWTRDFSLRPAQIVLTFAAAIATQDLWSRATGRSPVVYRSALITALSLTLLLRADNLWVHPLAAAIAISSKFTMRVRGKHLFNPANLGVIFALIALPGTWASAGQWGQDIVFAGWLLMLGALVAYRARRGDIGWSFLIIYMGLLAIRVMWLGQSAAVWTHQLSNGAILLFAFFMISDPMTAPNSARGRIAHAALVAAAAYAWQFGGFFTNGFLWALFFAAPLVPIWDAVWPAAQYQWTTQGGLTMPRTLFRSERRAAIALMACAIVIGAASTSASAFCGFYVGKADGALHNHASQVVYARNGDRSVLSIMNDYEGEPSEFALVVPVPVVLRKDQIHIGDRELFNHLNAYSTPRLVEYYDPDPCPSQYPMMNAGAPAAMAMAPALPPLSRDALARATGVTIEAQYTVGEYDIEILSATQSDGLESYLRQSGYKIPIGTSRALRPYIRQEMKFFLAKVNLKEQARTGLTYLRPIQFAFESPKFMLPIRLGMINAQGPQDLIIYLLTKDARVETTNYRTVKMPTGMDLPLFVEDDFDNFYKAMFARQVEANDMRAVFTEYVWNLGTFCDPCAAAPVSADELRALGVFWIDNGTGQESGGVMRRGAMMPGARGGFNQPYEGAGPGQVILTRLHVRYSAATFPEDLTFQETGDTENYQARFVLRHPWAGSATVCPEAKSYLDELRDRRQTEATTLADLTGWDIKEVYRRAGMDSAGAGRAAEWWGRLWQ